MDVKDSLPRPNGQILEEAAYWLVEFNAGDFDATVQQRFQAWLRTSPEHVRAYLDLVPIWEAGPAMPLEDPASVESLIALGRIPDNVVAFGTTGVESSSIPPALAQSSVPPRDPTTTLNNTARSRALQPRWLTLAACFALIATAVVLLATFGGDPTYQTGIGQQQSIGLTDGSTIELNARSKVRIHLTERQRQVELLAGQALFRVATDSTRPFVVSSGSTRIRAVGTQFDVYRKESGTTVTVVEGRVAVLPDRSESGALPVVPAQAVSPSPLQAGTPNTESSLFLDAGEQVTVAVHAAPKARLADVAAATAWTQHRLVFDASTLAEVIEEFNRYNTRRLALRDPSLASFPISGAFSSTDPTSLVRFLRMQPGIHVTVRETKIEIARVP